MVFTINCTVGAEGLCPALVVLGTLPRQARATPTPTKLGRDRMIKFAMNEVKKEQARKRTSFGLRHKGLQKGAESSQVFCQLPAGATVLVYSFKSKAWKATFKSVQIKRETVVVQTSRGRKVFRLSCDKQFTKPSKDFFMTKDRGEICLRQ